MTTSVVRPARRAADVFAAEWIKLRSVRSTYWIVFVIAAIMVGASVLYAENIVDQWDRIDQSLRKDFDPLSASVSGLYIAQVGFCMLGVLMIGSEYATGQIRTTLTAVPRRLRVLGAKALVVAVAAFGVGALTALEAFAVGQPIFAEQHINVTLADPGVPRGLLGAALFAGLVALVGLGVAAITRHTAGAIAAVFSVLFVPPIAVKALPTPWDERVYPYLLSELGQQMYGLQPAELSPGVATIACGAYAAVALALAGVLISRRDV